MARHYGMDWLRIGAFACLILYHIGMVFVPWPFHAKAAQIIDWTTIPMLAVSPWRLTLLFVVSGYASRALLRRWGSAGRFAVHRTPRLLVPLAFGMIVLVPPQPFVELAMQHGYARGFSTFYLHDYWTFRSVGGLFLPTWNHLWFVAYLWIYTMALALFALLPLSRLQGGFDRLFGGIGVIVVPVLWLLASQVVVFQRWSDTQDVLHDGIAHMAYLPAFLFGFGLAASERAMAAMIRWHRLAGVLALASYGAIVWTELAWPGTASPPQWVADATVWLRQLQCWGAVVALVGVAEVHLNRDHPWRRTLTEAIFPFYLIHQTAIVLGVYWLAPLALPAAPEFAALFALTVFACWAFYLIGRRIDIVRPLIGLRPAVATPAQPATTEPTL
ncbi:acyltransferase family protein [Sphingomonas sp. RS2018]